MNFLLSIQVGLREILAHKFRSFLTMVGIILGVSSLVTMFAIIDGTTRGMKEFLMRMGGLEIVQVVDAEVPVGQESLKSLSPGRTMEDVDAIRRECPFVSMISPEVDLGNATVQFSNQSIRPRVTGGQESFLPVNNLEVSEGRFISNLDLEHHTQVCVIGEVVWEGLKQSPKDSPLGKTLVINGLPFQVVGVMPRQMTEYERRNQEKQKAAQERMQKRRSPWALAQSKSVVRDFSSWRNFVVVIPMTTMQSIFKSASLDLGSGVKGRDIRLSRLNVKLNSASDISGAVERLRSALLKTHHRVEDFGFNTREDWSENIETSVRAARLSGGIIAGISLVIGGIGIANIMLASITERIREIGIRMAVGARRWNIFLQVLVESSMLGFWGGLIGMGVAIGLVELVSRVVTLDNAPVVTTSSLATSFSFAILTGILAGIYPSIRASRLNPIQALRF
jgi:putative ABC transport system permease protein